MGIDRDMLMQRLSEANREFTGETFPIEVLPARMRRIVEETHRALNYPVDYTATAMFAAMSVAIGKSCVVKFKEGWTEQCNFYFALVGRPGANKSHPLSFALEPIVRRDCENNRIYEEEMNRYEESLRKGANDGGERLPMPRKRRSLVNDITPEGLSFLLQQNPRGLCLYRDELAGWYKNFNRYHNGAEEEFWISLFNGKATFIDRRGSPRSIVVDNPFITVVGTIQPSVLGELTSGSRSQNGFVERILFAMPDNQGTCLWNDNELAPTMADDWGRLVNKAFDIEMAQNERGEQVARVLSFDMEARRRLMEWQNEMAAACQNEDDAIIGINMKLEIYAIRLCLLMQVLRHLCGEAGINSIDVESVERAIRLTAYFRHTAIKVRAIADDVPLTELQSALLEALPDSFSTGQGVEIAENIGMPQRTFKAFLKQYTGILFARESHGRYRKMGRERACTFSTSRTFASQGNDSTKGKEAG